MLPSKNSSWFLWVEKGSKKKKWERETPQILYLGELLEIIFGKTKTRETGGKYVRHLRIGGNFFPP